MMLDHYTQTKCLLVSYDPHLVPGIIETAGRQTGVDVQLVLTLHGFDDDECRTIMRDNGLALSRRQAP